MHRPAHSAYRHLDPSRGSLNQPSGELSNLRDAVALCRRVVLSVCVCVDLSVERFIALLSSKVDEYLSPFIGIEPLHRCGLALSFRRLVDKTRDGLPAHQRRSRRRSQAGRTARRQLGTVGSPRICTASTEARAYQAAGIKGRQAGALSVAEANSPSDFATNQLGVTTTYRLDDTTIELLRP